MRNDAILITARSASTRLKEKMYIKIGGKSVIKHVIDNAKLVLRERPSTNIILCTTLHKEDDRLVEIARKSGINYWRGSVEDKIERWLGALLHFNCNYFCPMDGEDILADPFFIVKAFQHFDHDFSTELLVGDPGMPVGAFLYCVKTSLLQKIYESKKTSNTEMVFNFWKDASQVVLSVPYTFKKAYRLTLDYQEDVKFLEKMWEELDKRKMEFNLWNVLTILEMKPELEDINAFRAKDWAENQERTNA